MSMYTGVTGKLSIKQGEGAKTDVAHINNWSVELKKEMIEDLSFGNQYKERIPSTKDWTASSEGKADFASTSGQKLLLDAYNDGLLITATFSLTDTIYFEGDAYVESLSFKDSADGAGEISISLVGNGGIELTVPA